MPTPATQAVVTIKFFGSNLEIISSGMAVIPTEWETELLCYEFKGKVCRLHNDSCLYY